MGLVAHVGRLLGRDGKPLRGLCWLHQFGVVAADHLRAVGRFQGDLRHVLHLGHAVGDGVQGGGAATEGPVHPPQSSYGGRVAVRGPRDVRLLVVMQLLQSWSNSLPAGPRVGSFPSAPASLPWATGCKPFGFDQRTALGTGFGPSVKQAGAVVQRVNLERTGGQTSHGSGRWGACCDRGIGRDPPRTKECARGSMTREAELEAALGDG